MRRGFNQHINFQPNHRGGGQQRPGSNRHFFNNPPQPPGMFPIRSSSFPSPPTFPPPHSHPPLQSNFPHSPVVSAVVLSSDTPPVETVVARLETATRLLHGIGGNNTRVNEIAHEIQILSEDLRRVGPHLETSYPEVLDRVMSSMRDASAQPSLPASVRLAIFELVELRASKWLLPSDSSNYYRQRRNIGESGDERAIEENGTSSDHSTSPTSKTYREEVLIKNSDSGKVSPTAKERVLSINGYSQQSLNMAKQLIQETIARNASPVFDGLSSGDCPDGDSVETKEEKEVLQKLQTSLNFGQNDSENTTFTYTVTIGPELIKISGSNLAYVQEAKLALDDHFSEKYPDLFSNGNVDEEETEAIIQNLVPKYSRSALLNLSLTNTTPDFSHLDQFIRDAIILKERRDFDPNEFLKENHNREFMPVDIQPAPV